VDYLFLLVAPVALVSLLLCLRYPHIGVHFVRPYPRTCGEHIALLTPSMVFWTVLAANAFLPISAQLPYVMFFPPTLPTLDAPLDQWLAFGNMTLLGSAWLAALIISALIALRHVWANRDRWMMGP
jgi:hypothetical protein